MSVVSYGVVNLQMTKTQFDVTPERTQDGADLVSYRVRLTCDFIYNPFATSYVAGDPDSAPAPTFAEGQTPAQTYLAIKQYMLTPRRQLYYATVAPDPDDPADYSQAVYIIQSPAEGQTCDVNGGPYPVSFEMKLMGETKTWRGRWVVETHLLDCPVDSLNDALVSNRWEQTHSINEDYYTVITTKGVAVLRMDALAQFATVADQYRSKVFPPVPPGFKRGACQVTVNSLGNLLMYTCQDVEKQYYLGTRGNKSRLGVASFNAVMATSHAPFEAAASALTTIVQLVIQVKGDKTAKRAALEQFAAQLVVERLQVIAGPIDPTQNTLIRRVEIVEYFDTDSPPAIQMTTEGQLPAKGLAPLGVGTLNTMLLGRDVITILANDGNSPNMPHDSNTRGFFFGNAIAQGLQGPCMAVPAPGAGTVKGGTPGSNLVQISNDPPPDGYLVNTTVSDTPPPPFYNNQFSDGAAALGPWTEAKIDVRYDFDPNLAIAPNAGNVRSYNSGGGSGGGTTQTQSPPSTVSVMQLALPTQYKIVDGTFERIGSPPLIPNPVVSDPNLTLYKSSITAAAPEIAADGQTLVWRASFTHKYVVLNPYGPTPNLQTAALPYMTLPFNNATIYENNYASGIIDGGSGTGGDNGGDGGDLGGGDDSGG